MGTELGRVAPSSNGTSLPSTFPCRCHLDMYPHRSPLHSFPRPVLSLQLGAQHPCLLGRPPPAPILCPRLSLLARHCSMYSPSPSLQPNLRSSSMSSPSLSLSLCLWLTVSLEVPQPHLQPLSFLQ